MENSTTSREPIEDGSHNYLAIYPWDVDRWRLSDAYRELTLAGQGAYLNLCFRAWQEQPDPSLPDDDQLLWFYANARTLDEWLALRESVLKRWEIGADGRLRHDVVTESFEGALSRHVASVRRGQKAGRASARARHNLLKRKKIEHTFNTRSTQVDSPSPSPSPKPSPKLTETETAAPQAAPTTTALVTVGSDARDLLEGYDVTEQQTLVEAWETHFGKGSLGIRVPKKKGGWTTRGGMNPGRIVRALMPLVTHQGFAHVDKNWRRYLAERDHRFATPEEFAQKYLAWQTSKTADKRAMTPGQMAATAGQAVIDKIRRGRADTKS